MLLARRVVPMIVLSLSVVLLAGSRCPAAAAEGKAQKQKQKIAPKVRVIQPRQIQARGGQIQIFRQGFPGGFARGLNTSYLLRRPDVQKELKITDDQKAKIDAVFAERQKGPRMAFGADWRNMPPEERQKKMAEFQKQNAKNNAEMQKKLDAVLNDGQRKRLMGIGIQMQGFRALAGETVAKELGLSDEQKEKIKTVIGSQQKKMQTLYQDLRDGKIERNKIQEKRADVQKEIEAAAMGALTAEQKKKFEALKGEKFELKRQQFQIRPKVGPRKPRPGDEV